MPGGQALLRLIARFAPQKLRSALVFILLLLRSAMEVLQPMLVSAVIALLAIEATKGSEEISLGNAGAEGLFENMKGMTYEQGLWILAIVMVVRQLMYYVSQVAAAALGQDIENTLRRDLFAQVMALRFKYHDENRSGATIARALRDMEKTKHFFREVFFGYLEMILLLITVIAVVFHQTHWGYGLIISGFFVTGVIVTCIVGVKIAQRDRHVSDAYDEVSTVLQENVAGARVVRAFGQEPSEEQKFGGRMDTFSDGWRDLERFWTGWMPTINHAYHMAIPFVLILGAYWIHTGVGGLQEILFVLLVSKTVHRRLRPLTRLVILGQQAVASAARVFEVLDRTDRIEPNPTPKRLPAGGGHLRFENVTFSHVPGRPVLEGVDLDVPAGESLGILGVTGAGKSSLVHLVPRFYDPEQGRVLLDGIDIQDLDVHELRSEVGLVFQEPFLFSGTVTENVRYGRPEATDAEVARCVELAAAKRFVEGLPKGYDTMVGERGVSLSGGQRQRLTIARALAMDPRLLIFDDATASVDAVTERQLFQGIRKASSGRTTIVISQRVTSVRWCDRIAVLEQGRITAIGTHEELLGKSSLYGEIFEHQRLTGVAS